MQIKKMYDSFETQNCYVAKSLQFENPQYVYEAIANFVPAQKKLRFDIRTKEQSKEYKELNMCSWNRFVSINRIDLVMAVLLFTEEFIL